MTEISIITATADRPIPFQFCERWVSRSIEFAGIEVEWIVVDSGAVPVECSQGQIHIRRRPTENRLESFLGNLLAGLEMAESEKILFMEDDDWYSPNYITAMSAKLDRFDICGESGAKSYSPMNRRYWTWESNSRASLAQTGIRRNLSIWMQSRIPQMKTPFVDGLLWREAIQHQYRFDLTEKSKLCVGMKGMPGRSGFTHGHREYPELLLEDHDGHVLRGWIGSDDAAEYESLREFGPS